jgi:hypothetical protein
MMASSPWPLRRTPEVMELWPQIKAKAALQEIPIVQIFNEAILKWFYDQED